MYQNFVALLTCSQCGVTTDDETSELQTGILTRGVEPPPLYLKIGDQFSMIRNGPIGAGYLTLKNPQENESIHLLQVWECPACDLAIQWAEIVLTPSKQHQKEENIVEIESIQSVLLNRSILERVHFISDQLVWIFEEMTGTPLLIDNKVRDNVIELMRQHLPN